VCQRGAPTNGSHFARPDGYGGILTGGFVNDRQGTSTLRMVYAMGNFAEVLHAFMESRGLSGNALAGKVPCDPGLISRYVNGKQQPSLRMARRLDDVLGAGGELTALARRRRTEAPLPGDEDDVRRRELLGVLGGTVAAASLTERLERLRRSLDGALGTVPTERDADEWDRAASNYAHEVGVLAPGELLPPLLADFGELADRLDEATGHVQRRLIHTAAQLGGLAAIVLTSLGDAVTARRWWRTAARAADASGDYRAAALIRGRQAVFSLYSGEPTSTLGLASAAIAAGQRKPCAGVASAYAARAQALAQAGRDGEARQALDRLEDVFAQLPNDVSGDYFTQWGWSEIRLRHVQSYVFTRAADLRAAGRAQDAALALYPETSYQGYQGRTQVEMHRAECLIRAGDVDAGAQHAARVISTLPPAQRQDNLVALTALTALRAIPEQQRQRPSARAAREMLALPGPQR
jgi:transcriptional regulator with XRE-family HTH domain